MYIKRGPRSSLFSDRHKRRNYGRIFLVSGLLLGGIILLLTVFFDEAQQQVMVWTNNGPTPTPLPADLATQAMQFFVTGDLAEAKVLFEQALDQRPDNVDFMYEYGKIQREMGDYEAALATADQMLSAAPSDPRGYELKARTQILDDRPSAAISVALAGIDLGQGFAAPLYASLARAYTATGNYVDAVDSGVRAVEADANSVEARLAYAEALNFFDERDEALIQLEIAFNIDPTNIQTHFDLAFQYLARDRDQEAIDMYNRILALQPRNARANLWLCRSYKKVGQFERALDYCQDSINLDQSSPAAYYELGTLHYRNYDFANALDAFSACATLNPDSLECAYRSGLSHYYVSQIPGTDPQSRDEQCELAWNTLQDSLIMAQGRFGVDDAIENIRVGLVVVTQDCPNYRSSVVPGAEVTPEVTPEAASEDNG